MSIKHILSFIIPIFALTSCGTSQQDYNLYTITINAPDYRVEGATKYQYGKNAHLTIKPKNNAYLLPTSENLKIYGSHNISYNQDTGELNFVIERDVRLDIESNCIYGKAITLAEAGVWFNSHYNNEERFTWDKQVCEWNLPGANFPDSDATDFLNSLVISEDEDLIVPPYIDSANGTKEFVNSEQTEIEHSDLDVGILGRNINRYYLNNNQLTIGSDDLPKKFDAASGDYYMFLGLTNKMVMDSVNFYFYDYMPSRHTLRSTLNGELHWSINPIQI